MDYISNPESLKDMSELKHNRFYSLQDQGIKVPKQRSPEWFHMRKGKLSGSKLSQFLFIDTIDDFIIMFEEIWEGRKKPAFTEEQKKWVEWGCKYEDTAMENLLNNVKDIYVFEAPMVQHGDVLYLSASPDGFYDQFDPVTNEVIETGIIEIKCPGKKKKASTNVTYYYVPQMYMEMAVSGRRNAIFCSWGPKTTRAWKIKWDDNVWNALCCMIDQFRNVKHGDKLKNWEKLQMCQFHLKRLCHQVVDSALPLHTDKGWSNPPFETI